MKKIVASVLLILLVFSVSAALADGSIDIISSSDLTITITGVQVGQGPDGELLVCKITVDNGLGHSIDFSGSNCVFNGIETQMGVPALAKAGVSEKNFLFFPPEGMGVDYMQHVDSLTFDLKISNYETGEVHCDVPVYIGGDLPGMQGKDESAKQDKASDVDPAADEVEYFEPYLDMDMILIAEHDDFKLYFAGWKEKIFDDSASVRFYPLIQNWTDGDLDVRLDEVKFDATDVKGSSCFDVPPGGYTDDDFLFFEDDVDGKNPLVDPRWITFNVVVKDSATRDLIAEIPVRLHAGMLNEIPDDYPWDEDVYPDYTYEEDIYPDYTYEEENVCHLQMFADSYCSWDYRADGMMAIRVEVVNTHPTKTVKNFEMLMYGTEADGDILPGGGRFYCESTSKRIAPGEVAVCNDFHVYGETMEKVSFAVNYVEYTDGSVEIVPDSEWLFGYWYIN